MRQSYLEHAKYYLRPGYIFVPGKPTLISVVLGSCVAVSLWDRSLEYGGMNHFLYPMVTDPQQATAQYGNVATNTLIRLFLGTGSRIENLEAQILGGAAPADGNGNNVNIGQQNVDMARSLVQVKGIRIASQDVGGNKGRKAIYNSQTNEMIVIRVERLRQSDWYPYRGER